MDDNFTFGIQVLLNYIIQEGIKKLTELLF
jgi:hypothetical protein